MLKLSVEERKVKTIFNKIIGVDESGICCYVGPCVVAVVELPKQIPCSVDDCKKLDDETLKKLYYKIVSNCNYRFMYVTEKQCDESHTQYEIKHIKTMVGVLKPDFVFLDYISLPTKFNIPQWGIKKGDEKIWCIAAASVIAKYEHDEYMRKIDKEYPEYEFASNRGSFCNRLFDLTVKYGLTKYHRPSWVESAAKKKGVNFKKIKRRK